MKKTHRITSLALSVLALAVAGSASAATIVGTQTGSSAAKKVEVGASQVPFGPHTAGKAGIGISDYAGGLKVDFQGLTPSSTATALGNGMTAYRLHDPVTAGTPGDPNNPAHNGLGSFSFVKVGSGDVWFGEWSKNGNTGSPIYQDRQVYYVGDKDGYSPATGSAVAYTLTGVHLFGGTNTNLTGSLTANFNARTFHGDLGIGATQIRLGSAGSQIAFDTAGHFDAANAGQWIGPRETLIYTGRVTGDFFGAGASAVAGIVDFGVPGANIAWGGTQN